MPHDRTGELVDDEPATPFHDPRCRNGWIDRDADQAVPCLVCRPHLRKTVRPAFSKITHERNEHR